MQSCLELQDRSRRSMQYEPLGRIFLLETDRGAIHFQKQCGPGVARDVDSGQALFISGWPALPSIQEHSEEFCTACLAECDVCSGSGKALCQALGCGGAGKRIVRWEVCSHEGAAAGIVSASCPLCRGTNSVPVPEDCPTCSGTGKAKCSACRGMGKAPTGYLNGVRDRNAADCEDCRGTLRAGKFKAQDLATFVSARVGEFLGIAVKRMIVEPAVIARGSGGFQQIEVAPNARGTPLMVLLRIASPNGIPYFYGGEKF